MGYRSLLCDVLVHTMTIDKRFLSRKFQLCVAAFLFATVFFGLDMLASAEWMDYTRWIVGLYLAGNIGDTVAEKAKVGA